MGDKKQPPKKGRRVMDKKTVVSIIVLLIAVGWLVDYFLGLLGL
jgi:hypothetical protein